KSAKAAGAPRIDLPPRYATVATVCRSNSRFASISITSVVQGPAKAGHHRNRTATTSRVRALAGPKQETDNRAGSVRLEPDRNERRTTVPVVSGLSRTET